MSVTPPRIVVEHVLDPQVRERMRARQEQFRRNLAWFEPRAAEFYAAHRGKHLCVAGEELFVADDARDVLARAKAAHPEDEGVIFLYVPREAMERIYAAQRVVAALP